MTIAARASGVLLCAFAACGGSELPEASGSAGDRGDGGAPDAGRPQIVVTVAPAVASVAAGARQQFTATVTGTTDIGVRWSIEEGAGGGTVDDSGLYRAPFNAGTYHVLATSHADPAKSAAATLTVTALPERLSMAAFDSSLVVGELSLDVMGAGSWGKGNPPGISSRIGRISLHGSEGTVEIDGRSLPSIVFERQSPVKGSATNLYEVISVAPDRLYLMWIDCRTTTSEIQLWIESTAGEGLVQENGSGSCHDTPAPSNPRLRAPAISMDWPQPVRGFSVSGPGLDLPNGARGTVLYEGETQVVFPFNWVNCFYCGSPGWFELHSLLWNPSTSAVALGIFYLVVGGDHVGGDHVILAYTLSMPVLTRGPVVSYRAMWSLDLPSRPEGSFSQEDFFTSHR